MASASSPNKRRTLAARAALAARFPTPEAKAEYYRELGARGHAARLTLSGEERAALFAAYDLLRSIAARHGLNQADAAGNGGTK